MLVMTNKKMYIVSGFLILLLTLFAGYYLEKLRNKANPIVQTPVNVGIREIIAMPADMVTKSVGLKDGVKVITYQLKGELSDIKRSGSMASGVFTIKSDPKNRKIKIYFGTNQESLLLGTYTSANFLGDSSWQVEPLDDSIGKINNANGLVLLEVQYQVKGEAAQVEEISGYEKILDSYIDSMHTGNYDSEIPADFMLYSYKMAISE